MLIICILLLIASIVVFLIIKPFGKGSSYKSGNNYDYTEVIPAYFDFVNRRGNNFQEAINITFAPCIVDAYYEYSDIFMVIDKDMVESYEDENLETYYFTLYDLFDSAYGSNWTIEVSDLDYTPISKDDLEKELNRYYDIYDELIDNYQLEDEDYLKKTFASYNFYDDEIKSLIKSSTKLLDSLYDIEITEGYEVSFNITLSNGTYDETNSSEMCIYKVNGSWILNDSDTDPFTGFIDYAITH